MKYYLTEAGAQWMKTREAIRQSQRAKPGRSKERAEERASRAVRRTPVSPQRRKERSEDFPRQSLKGNVQRALRSTEAGKDA
jgi:hypothetical protein